MSAGATTYDVQQPSSSKMLRAMVGIGILCALMIVLMYEGTLPRIERLRAEAFEKAIFRVVPGITSKQTFRYDAEGGFTVVADDTESEQRIYAGYSADNELVGFAIEASGMGFADVLKILYGYDPHEQQVIGFYVLESKETPGLGDKIEKDPAFLANFDGLDVSLTDDETAVKNRIVPVKQGEKEDPWEVDGITGATISSWAIGDILGESTVHWAPLIANHLNTLQHLNQESNENKWDE